MNSTFRFSMLGLATVSFVTLITPFALATDSTARTQLHQGVEHGLAVIGVSTAGNGPLTSDQIAQIALVLHDGSSMDNKDQVERILANGVTAK